MNCLKKIMIIVSLLLVLTGYKVAHAYDVKESMEPTDLTIRIVVYTEPIHNNFTRYLTFVNMHGVKRSVAVAFSKSADLTYIGHVTTAGLNTLCSLVPQDNRSFWDTMYFENHGGSTALNIYYIDIWIEYGNHASPWEPNIMIGLEYNKYLDSGDDSFYVSRYSGRREFAKAYFHWTTSQFLGLPSALRYFIYDIGKSGSSSSNDSTLINPKYGLTGQNLCSETVSWYYYTYNVRIRDLVTNQIYDFREITGHNQMHDAFKNSGRLYAYHLGRKKWILKDRDYNWVKDSNGNYITYMPKAGDYLDRRPTNPSVGDDGHAMMLVKWDDVNKVAYVLDGPFPISFRKVKVDTDEQAGIDFCVGRIPDKR